MASFAQLIIADTEIVESTSGIADVARLGLPRNVPFVFWSSRTFSEVAAIQSRYGFDGDPFFAENGSALFIPKGRFSTAPMLAIDIGDYYLMEFGCRGSYAVGVVDSLARTFSIEVERPQQHSVEGRGTNARWYDDAFRLRSVPRSQLFAIARVLRRAGLRWTTSSSLSHVNGVLDPGVGLSFIRSLYDTLFDQKVICIGIGRTLNHAPILREVDIPIVIADGNPRVTRRLRRESRGMIAIKPHALPLLLQALVRTSPAKRFQYH